MELQYKMRRHVVTQRGVLRTLEWFLLLSKRVWLVGVSCTVQYAPLWCGVVVASVVGQSVNVSVSVSVSVSVLCWLHVVRCTVIGHRVRVWVQCRVVICTRLSARCESVCPLRVSRMCGGAAVYARVVLIVLAAGGM